MQKQAIIMRPDHTNTRVRIGKHNLKDGFFGHNGRSYVLDPDHFQITKTLFGNCITFYYSEDCAKPLPVPDFQNIKRIGIDNAELNAIFNPWFLRQISQQGPSSFEKLQLGAVLVTLGASLYIAYTLAGLPDLLADRVAEALARVLGG